MGAERPPDDARTVLIRALREIKTLKARVAELEREAGEPIAVVGAACRFPGHADTPDRFWELLRDGVDAIGDVPRDRWNAEAIFDPDPHAPGRIYTKAGGFIDGVARFDPAFFGIAPREAAAMDPQQRLLLMVAWEAVEHAGLVLDGQRSDVGLFVGISTNDYAQLLMERASLGDVDGYTLTGNSPSVASGRLAHALGLRGPAISLDTACSSSLVAVHLACQSLRKGECDAALAGGVNVMLSPFNHVAFCRMGALSRSGAVRAFDASADGFVRGEGCGVIVLRRLHDAIASGDRILAVVRGSAVNHDGRSSGLTVPHGPSQQAVMRRALRAAGVEPGHVGYIEAHGTGTPLGDPVELQSIAAVYGGAMRVDPILIGSVKTNVGHLEAAAGMAGLMKVLLALDRGAIPPQLHFETPNPRVDWTRIPVRVATALTPWPASGEAPRMAAVSAFGISGTNAHVVLEAADPYVGRRANGDSGTATSLDLTRPQVFVLSAKSEARLDAAAARLRQWLSTPAAADLAAVCQTAQTRRVHFDYRFAVVVRSHEDLQRALASDAGRGDGPRVLKGTRRRTPAVTFVFDEESVVVGAGRALYVAYPAFREAIDRATELAVAYLDRPLRELMFEDGVAGQPIAQPAARVARLALQYAVTQLWQAWGIEPAAILANGEGEYAAAVAAGVCDLKTALALVAARAGLAPTAAPLTMKPPAIEVFSASAGGAASREMQTTAYWERVAAGRGDFGGAVRAWTATPASVALAIDVETDENTAARVRRFAGEATVEWLPSRPLALTDPGGLLETLAALYVTGSDVNWPALDAQRRQPAALPLTAFETQDYWIADLPASASARQRRHAETVDPWLGERIISPLAAAQFVTSVDGGSVAFLADHLVHDRFVVAGSAHIARCMLAVQQIHRWTSFSIERLLFSQPLVLSTGERRSVALTMESRADGTSDVVIASAADSAADEPAFQTWTQHVTGVLSHATSAAEIAERLSVNDARSLCLQEVAAASFYAQLESRGYRMGPAFRWLEQIWSGDDIAVARVREIDAAAGAIPPGLIDAGLQLLSATRPQEGLPTYVPYAIDSFRVHGPMSGSLWCVARLRPDATDAATVTGDVWFYGGEGDPVLTIAGVRARAVTRAQLERSLAEETTRRAPDTYTLRWKAVHPSTESQAAAADWLLFAHRGAATDALVRRLEQAGGRCAIVEPGTEYRERAPRRWCIRPHEEADYRRVLDEALRDARLPPAIVHLWACGSASDDARTASRLDAEQALGAESVLLTLKAIASQSHEVSLQCVTADAAGPSARAAVTPAHAALWGLGPVIGREYGRIWKGLIDVAVDDPALAAQLLADELAAGRGASVEDRVALRRDGRFVARLVPASETHRFSRATDDGRAGQRRDGTWLVTGGSGHLGRIVTEWLVARGVRHLVLASRTFVRGDRPDWIAALDKAGVTVVTCACDVSDGPAVNALVEQIAASMPPLVGVLHLAGVLKDRTLAEETVAGFREVFAPKAAGAWNLHTALAGFPIEHFILFSSAAPVLGAPGQGAYSAANAALDGLARFRRARGLPAVSINWGPWADGGMAAGQDPADARWRRFGIEPLAVAAGLVHLDAALFNPPEQLLVLPRSAGAPMPQAPLFAELTPAPPAERGAPGSGRAAHGSFRATLDALPPASRRTALVEQLKARAAAVLGIQTSGPIAIAVDHPLQELGMDSMMAVELRNAVVEAIDRDLPITLLFDYPSIARIADFVLETLYPPAPDATTGAADATAAQVAQLSDEEAAAQLARVLAELT
jgi:acyl transferase domain-containing protein